MKIVVLDAEVMNPGDLSWGALEALGELTVYPRTALEDILPRLAGAELVLTMKTPLSRETLAAPEAQDLRYIGVLFTGYDVVDTLAAAERGIPVCNVPAYSTASVAQLTMALLLEICHHVGDHSAAIHEGAWVQSPNFSFSLAPLIELRGLTLAVLGAGRVGRQVMRLALAFEMKVLAWVREAKADLPAEVEQVQDLDEVLRRADVLSLNLPLNETTRGLISEAALRKMKPSAMIVNTGRGPLVDEAAVAQALRDNRLYAYASDVLSREPMPAEHPLLGAPRCVLTPHIAWAPLAARRRLMQITVDNVAAFLAGRPQNVLNQPRV